MNNNRNRSRESSTPYDDVFRTLMVDCRKLLIPLINEVFGENYTGDEEVVFKQNEHFLGQQDGREEKIITDSSFEIIGKITKKYLLECQSTEDSSMLVRIFEYSTQIALDDGVLTGNRLIISIPRSAVLFLRSTKNTPDFYKIEVDTPGGSVEFDVPVMKVKDYTIDEIFAKGLFFLIPFYIFVYESKFTKMEEVGEGLAELRNDYKVIIERLDEAARKGQISAFTRKAILEMSGKVLEKIAAKYDKVREGVKNIMGGKVLEYEAKDILNQGLKRGREEGRVQGREEGREEGRVQGREEGREEGRVQGREEGREEGRVEGREEGRVEGRAIEKKETAIRMKEMGMDSSFISKALGIGEDLVKEWIRITIV